jgi:hypothetical protein
LLFESRIKSFFQMLRPILTFETISAGTILRRLLRKKTFWILLGIGLAITIANNVKHSFNSNKDKLRTVTFMGAVKPGKNVGFSPALIAGSVNGTQDAMGMDSFPPMRIAEVFDSLSAADEKVGASGIAADNVARSFLRDSISLWQQALKSKDFRRFETFYDSSFECRFGNFKSWERAPDNILLRRAELQSIMRLSVTDIREERLGKSLFKLNMTVSFFSAQEIVKIGIATLWQNKLGNWRIIRENQRRQ